MLDGSLREHCDLVVDWFLIVIQEKRRGTASVNLKVRVSHMNDQPSQC
jgi:hypothetical protein